MYTIGEISKKFNLNISTIRYYDKEGLFPNIKRKNGIRKFDNSDVESILVIECLKKTGMKLKEIKKFLDWCTQGDSTLNNRLKMFIEQKNKTLSQIDELKKALNLINYKCWYYEEAVKRGSDKDLKNIDINNMPNEIKSFYINWQKNK